MSNFTIEELHDATLQFEAVQIAMKKSVKEGWILTLSVHPDEVPDGILRDRPGARYQCVLVRLSDQEEPMIPQDVREGTRAVKSAGILCTEPGFQAFLYNNGWSSERTEQAAAIAIHDICGIASRGELKTNKEARQKFLVLRDQYVKEGP